MKNGNGKRIVAMTLVVVLVLALVASMLMPYIG